MSNNYLLINKDVPHSYIEMVDVFKWINEQPEGAKFYIDMGTSSWFVDREQVLSTINLMRPDHGSRVTCMVFIATGHVRGGYYIADSSIMYLKPADAPACWWLAHEPPPGWACSETGTITKMSK